MSETLRILLTGGAGMVGQNIQESDLGTAHELWAPSRQEMDLGDSENTCSVVTQYRPDMIIHAAGKVGGIQANMADLYGFFRDNVQIGMNLLDALINLGSGSILNLGSSCMYPPGASNPLSEKNLMSGPLEPTNEGYAIAKSAVARAGSWVDDAHPDIQARTIIPCNLYGRHDHFEPQRSHLVAAVLEKLHRAKAENASKVTIWGDGKARREFMYAADLADFMIGAVSRFDELPNVMNVGPGIDQSVNEYYRMTADVIGYEGHFEHDTTRPTGMHQKLMDVSRCKAWGWQPDTPLEAGIEETYAFYKNLVLHGKAQEVPP